jgi:hypothetical protein
MQEGIIMGIGRGTVGIGGMITMGIGVITMGIRMGIAAAAG